MVEYDNCKKISVLKQKIAKLQSQLKTSRDNVQTYERENEQLKQNNKKLVEIAKEKYMYLLTPLQLINETLTIFNSRNIKTLDNIWEIIKDLNLNPYWND